MSIRLSRNVKTELRSPFILHDTMDFHLKLVQLTEKGNHLIVITRGIIDGNGLAQIFRQISKATEALSECMIMIDLEDADLALQADDVEAIMAQLDSDQWHAANKLALVSSNAGTLDQ